MSLPLYEPGAGEQVAWRKLTEGSGNFCLYDVNLKLVVGHLTSSGGIQRREIEILLSWKSVR